MLTCNQNYSHIVFIKTKIIANVSLNDKKMETKGGYGYRQYQYFFTYSYTSAVVRL